MTVRIRALAPVLALLSALAALSAPGPALAKTEEGAAPRLRCARGYAEALAEAKDRGCVVFATFHSDG
jgi:hypothetical protein